MLRKNDMHMGGRLWKSTCVIRQSAVLHQQRQNNARASNNIRDLLTYQSTELRRILNRLVTLPVLPNRPIDPPP